MKKRTLILLTFFIVIVMTVVFVNTFKTAKNEKLINIPRDVRKIEGNIETTSDSIQEDNFDIVDKTSVDSIYHDAPIKVDKMNNKTSADNDIPQNIQEQNVEIQIIETSLATTEKLKKTEKEDEIFNEIDSDDFKEKKTNQSQSTLDNVEIDMEITKETTPDKFDAEDSIEHSIDEQIISEKDNQNTQKNMRVYTLEGISVIAEKPEESIGSIDVKHFSSQEPVKEISVSEALDDVSGLDLTVGGKNGSNLTIRGFKEEEIKIMIDGRPVSGNYMDAVDLTTLPLADVKEIQVLKGPVSSLYGSDTMGGVVNIITHSPSSELSLKLGTQIRRNNTNKFYANVSKDLGIADFSIYASRYNTDGMVLSDDFSPTSFENGSIRNHDKRTQYDFQGKLNFDFLDFHKIGLQMGYTTMPTKEIPCNIYESFYREFTDWERWQFSASGAFQLRYNLKWDSSIYYDQYSDTYVEYLDENYEEINSRFPSTLESWTGGTNQKIEWQLNSVTTVMSGIRYEKKAYNRKDNGSYLTWTSNNTQQMDYYLQSQYELNRFSFSAGSGLSLFKSKNNNNWNTHFQPSAGVYYTAPINLKLSLAASINTKYPTLRQLYSSSSGNENLKEESAFKAELTATQPFVINNNAGSVSSSLFYNDVTDMIDKLGGTYANIDDVESYGFEAEFKLKLGWEHEIDYSWLKFADSSDEQLIGAPEHRVNITETIILPYKIKFEYEAGWKDVRLSEEGDELPDYWLHSVQFNRNYKKFKFGFGLENIFDHDYQDQWGYPGEGRNFIVNVEYNL